MPTYAHAQEFVDKWKETRDYNRLTYMKTKERQPSIRRVDSLCPTPAPIPEIEVLEDNNPNSPETSELQCLLELGGYVKEKCPRYKKPMMKSTPCSTLEAVETMAVHGDKPCVEISEETVTSKKSHLSVDEESLDLYAKDFTWGKRRTADLNITDEGKLELITHEIVQGSFLPVYQIHSEKVPKQVVGRQLRHQKLKISNVKRLRKIRQLEPIYKKR